MDFVWDNRKNESNIHKHGLDFTDTYRTFQGPMLVQRDERQDYGEDRWTGIGFIDERVVVVIFSQPDEHTIRVISLRKALQYERERFRRRLKDQLGQG